MKKNIVSTAVVMIFFSLVCFAQPALPKQTKGGQVIVLNWGGRTVSLLPTFWTPGIEEQILTQLTKEQFEEIKQNCVEKAWPEGFTLQEEKMAKLKLIRIATFDNIRNGTNYGEISVVLVSPKENKDWNSGITWEKDVYFLFYSKDLELVK